MSSVLLLPSWRIFSSMRQAAAARGCPTRCVKFLLVGAHALAQGFHRATRDIDFGYRFRSADVHALGVTCALAK